MADDNIQETINLVQGIKISDPTLYQILMQIAEQQRDIIQTLNPVVDFVARTNIIGVVPDPPINLDYKILTSTIRLSWDRPPQGGNLSFEIRQGDDWASSEFVNRTGSTVVDLEPIAGETLKYLIKSLTTEGIYSTGIAEVSITVAAPGSVTIDGQVIDNNVLLRWSTSLSTLNIRYYELMKGNQVIGNHNGTFAMLQEVISGEYTYTVTPVDITGNRGTSSSITLRVNQPPDYVLTATHLSDFSGTKDQVRVVTEPSLVL